MGRNEAEARRILALRHGTKLDQLEEAAKALGGRLTVAFGAAWTRRSGELKLPGRVLHGSRCEGLLVAGVGDMKRSYPPRFSPAARPRSPSTLAARPWTAIMPTMTRSFPFVAYLILFATYAVLLWSGEEHMFAYVLGTVGLVFALRLAGTPGRRATIMAVAAVAMAAGLAWRGR